MAYFQITEVLPSVFRLEDPRGVGMTLLVGKERALLCDTCMGIGDSCAAVRAITDLPLTVVNTHAHLDHAGGDYQFPEVYLSQPEFEVARVWYEDDFLRSLPMEQNRQPVPPEFDREGYMAWKGENLRVLEPGTVFDLGGLTAETVPLPGHTAGSMGFLCRERQLLLTGDAISAMVYLVFDESLPVSGHIAMLERVKELPFTHMLSAHTGELLPKERIDLYLACARSATEEGTIPFRNPLFPHIKGRMFVYEDPNAKQEYAALIFVKGKLDLREETECTP